MNDNLENANRNLQKLKNINLHQRDALIIGYCLIYGFTAIVQAICYIADVIYETKQS